MPESLSKLVSNNALYTLHNQWTELQKFRLQEGCLPLVFSLLPDSDTDANIITQPRSLQPVVTELDKDGNSAMRPEF